MPWSPTDSEAKTHRADTKATKEQWSATANAVREKTGDDATAIKIANAAVRDHPSRHWSGH